MSSITLFLDNKFVLYRQTLVNNITSFNVVNDTVAFSRRRYCLIQPITDVETSITNENLAGLFEMYTVVNSDVLVGDKIIDSDGRDFRVDGVDNHNYGVSPYKKYILSLEA